MVAQLKATLWQAANKLRGSLPAGQYKDVVLGLVFLRYVSDLEHPAFTVPATACWKALTDNVTGPDIGQCVDAAMGDVMAANPALTGLLPQLYQRVDQRRLAELVGLLGDANFGGHDGHRGRDLIGEVYEYFLGNFARAEGKRGGEFFTPPSVVRLLVDILQPLSGRVYDPCCGSGGMFVQVCAGAARDVTIFGQESVEETWRMAKMNLIVHGIDDTGIRHGDTFVSDLHAGMQMDYVLANPPFNIKDWARDQQDPRWRFGAPPAGNANFAWLQHILSKLAPGGKAGVVMTNGSLTSKANGEGDIRARIVDADLVSCVVALPAHLFRNTGIPVCLWIFAEDKGARRGQVLFVDARTLGYPVDRSQRALTTHEIAQLADLYHRWTGSSENAAYEDDPGLCRTVDLAEIRAAGYALTPGRYVGAPAADDESEPVEAKLTRLCAELLTALDESAQWDKVVRRQVERVRWR
ncbi:type I restriction-modification system subunit M [Mycobacterium sp. 1423905.2]|uniref:class I SAM-dependent DNA methyltransferase n=1 Tax=Mycobacterium sp. 1423905.2 TaxID=1856859 RepID=UPI0007FC0E87|nr:type I restriction-modification system subunit M [Mycobacterium sp. 1423905.2]OBJ54122.1 restriction endonuclease subunit M [Mycobacterium sp. 1423905.2]